MFTPKLFTTLKTYNRQQFSSDLIAGLIVGVVALPLAIAFAIASGVGPARGLYTAIVAGFLISALGSGAASSSTMFVVARVIGGFAVGAASVISPAY